MKSNNLKINKIDSYIVIEHVKLIKYRDKLISELSTLLEIDKENICIAATTNDGIGAIGRGEAIEVITMVVLKTLQ